MQEVEVLKKHVLRTDATALDAPSGAVAQQMSSALQAPPHLSTSPLSSVPAGQITPKGLPLFEDAHRDAGPGWKRHRLRENW